MNCIQVAFHVDICVLDISDFTEPHVDCNHYHYLDDSYSDLDLNFRLDTLSLQ